MLEITVEDYIVNGETFEVSSDMLEQFKKDYPLAKSKREIEEYEAKKAHVESSKFIGDPANTQLKNPLDRPDRRYVTVTTKGNGKRNKAGKWIEGEPVTNTYWEDEWDVNGYGDELGMSFEEWANKSNRTIKTEIGNEADFLRNIEEDDTIGKLDEVVIGDKQRKVVKTEDNNNVRQEEDLPGIELVEDDEITIKQSDTGRNKIAYGKEFVERMKLITNDRYKPETLDYIFNGFIDKAYEQNKGEFEVDFKINEGETFKDELNKPFRLGNPGRRLMKGDQASMPKDEVDKFRELVQQDMPFELYNILEQANFNVENIDYNEVKALAATNDDVKQLMENFIDDKKQSETTLIQNKWSDVLSTEQMFLAVPQPNPDWNRRQNQVVEINADIKNKYRSTLVTAGVDPYTANIMANGMEYGKDYKIPQMFDETTPYKNASLFRDDVFKLTDPSKAVPQKEKEAYFDGLFEVEKLARDSWTSKLEDYTKKNTPVVSEIANLKSQIEAIDVDSLTTQQDVDWYKGLLVSYQKSVEDYQTGPLRAEYIVLMDELNYIEDIGKNIMNQANMSDNVNLAAWGSQFNYNEWDKFASTFETELVGPAIVLGAKGINFFAQMGEPTAPLLKLNEMSQLVAEGDVNPLNYIGAALSSPMDYTGLEGRAVNYFSEKTEDYQKEFAPPSKIGDVFDERSALTFGDWMTGALAENGLTIAQVLGPSMVARVGLQIQKSALKKALTKPTKDAIQQSAKGLNPRGSQYSPDLYTRYGDEWVPKKNLGKGYYPKRPGDNLYLGLDDLDSKLWDLTVKKNALQKANAVTMASFFTATGGGEMGRLEANYKQAEVQLGKLQEALSLTNDPNEQQEILSQIDYYTNLAESTNWQRTFQGLLFGTTEMYAEKFGTLRYVNNLQAVKKIAGRKGLQDTFVKGWNKSGYWKNRVKDFGYGTYNLGYGVAVENLEELLTAAGHGTIRRLVMGSTDPILKEVNWDLIANTTFASLIMQGPSSASQVRALWNYESSTYSDYKKSVEYATRRAKIQEQIDDETTSAARRKELEKEKNKLDQLVRLDNADRLGRFSRMRPETRERYLSLRARQNFNEKQLFDLANSGRFGEDGFAEEFEAAKKRVIRNNSQLEELMTNTKDKAALKRRRKELQKINDKKGTSTEFVVPEVAEANRMMFNTALDIANLLTEKNIIQFANVEEAEGYIKANKLDENAAQGIMNMFQIDREGYAYNDPTGDIYLNNNQISSALLGVAGVFFDTGLSGVFQSISDYEQFRAAVSPLHEVMHDEIDRRKVFSGIFKEAKNAALGITNWLTTMKDEGNLDVGVYNQMMGTLKKYNISTDTKAEDDVDASEILTTLGEAILGGYIKAEDISNMHGLKSFMNSIFLKTSGNLGKALIELTDPFATAEAMADFMKDYVEKQVMMGEVNKGAIPEEEKERVAEEVLGRQSVVAETNARDTQLGKDLRSKFTNEQLVRKLKNAKGAEKNAIEDILIDVAAKVGLKTMGFDSRAGLGNISYDAGYKAARGRVADRDLLNKFDPRINDNWSTYAGSQLKFDIKNVLEENKQSLDSESTDSEFAKQLVDESQNIESSIDNVVQDEVEATIDIYDMLPSEVKEEAKEEVDRKIKENNIDLSDANLTFKELQQIAPYETLAKFFGIPVSRITMPSDNLRKGDDIGDIQRFILKNVERLINTRPQGNAALVKTKGVEGSNIKPKIEGGQSAGIRSRNFLNEEYDKVIDPKTGKQKKTNNQLQYKIKPGDRKRFLSNSGITNNRVDKGYVPRGPESQYIKGVLELLARNMALTSFGQLVDQQQDKAVEEGKTTERQADTRKSTVRQQTAPAKAPKLRFSTVAEEMANPDFVFMRGQFNIDDSKRIDGLFENNLDIQLDEDGKEIPGSNKTFDIKTQKGMDQFLEAFKNDLITIDGLGRKFWFTYGKDGKVKTSVLTYSNASYGLTRSKWKVGDKIDGEKLKAGDPRIGMFKKPDEAARYQEFKDAVYAIGNDPDTKFGTEMKDIDWTLTKSYKQAFGDKEKYREKIIEGLENGDIEKWNENVAKVHKNMWKIFSKLMKDQETKNKYAPAIGSYLKLTANDATSWHRLGAQLIGYSNELTKRKPTDKGKMPKGGWKTIEFEHAMPATAAYIYLMDAIFNENVDFNTAYELVIDNYKMIVLDKAMDDKLRNARTANGYSLQQRMPDTWNVVTGKFWERYFNDLVFAQDGGIDPSSIIGLDGRTFADIYKVDAQGQPTTVALQKAKAKAVPRNLSITPKQVRPKRQSVSNDEVLNRLDNLQKAFTYAQNPNNPKKGISVYDFDDTLAITKSKIKVTMPASKLTKKMLAEAERLLGMPIPGTPYYNMMNNPSGDISNIENISQIDFMASKLSDRYTRETAKQAIARKYPKTFKIDATQFAKDSQKLEEQGATFDFSEFNKVVDGKKGPLANRLKKAIDKFGNKNIFVLTARPAAAAPAIYEFLKGIGMELPLENIIGLEDGSPQSKANWIVAKAADGYNDFYFVDDAVKNVRAVSDALNVLDVNSKVQVARRRNSAAMNQEFNDMIERKTGIKSFKQFSKTKAELVGAQKRSKTFFIPASADDFVGLLYSVLGKGKQGDADMMWIKQNLLDPFAIAMQNVSLSRITMQNDYKALKKALNIVPKDLEKVIPGSVFTKQNAVRIYMWDKLGYKIPGISNADLKEIKDFVNQNEYLKIFGNEIINVMKGQALSKPKVGWLAGTITTDLMDSLTENTRAFYLQDWQRNVDVIFSEPNLNKLEAAFGKPYRVALENILERMKSGINRNFDGDSLTGRFTDWMTNGIGVIMFFNTRSAMLQTISAVNFINLEDNNILAASKAFANTKQFYKDFMMIMNSPFLQERRGGLRFNVNESDIADMAKKDGMRGIIAKLLQVGFLPTQFADSLAIASGGASFYRNRVNTYLKQGMEQKEAEEQAFIDFREIAEESQQSSRPDRISMQQAGSLGRLILAFANTPMQYARLIGKAVDDIKNRRGNWKASVSKAIHYSLMQNLIFTATQQALFAIGFGDIDDEEEERKITNTANGMLDTLLRGLGFAGAVASAIKNAILKANKESKESTPEYEEIAYELLRLSPPLSSKVGKVRKFGRTLSWDMDKIKTMGWDIQNPGFLAAANLISAAFNLPIDRLITKAKNIDDAMSSDLAMWERMFLLGGWQAYELGVEKEIRPPKRRGRKRKKKFNPAVINGGVKINGVKLN